MAAKSNAKRKPAKPPATTEASKPPAVLEVGSDEWKEEVRKARARILGGRRSRPETEQSLKRVAELVAQHDTAARRGDVEECKKLRGWLTDQTARNNEWNVDPDGDGTIQAGWDAVCAAVLMDLRRRLDMIVDRLPEKEPRA